MSTHLIIGGGGFIGRHVGLALANQGHRVRLAGRSPAFPLPDRLGAKLTYEVLNISTANWDRVIEGVDVVHHYAWSSIVETAHKNPIKDLEDNVRDTLALLEAVRRRGSGRLIFVSSGGTVYGPIKSPPVNEDHRLEPTSFYGVGKLAIERYLDVYRQACSIDCRIARISNPFGIGQNVKRNQGAATMFMHNALADKPILIYGNGTVVRDYIHISDVASGLLALANATLQQGEPFIFNLGSGRGSSLNDIVKALEDCLGRRVSVEYMPARPYDVPVNVLDITRAYEQLGWMPRLSLIHGLQQTLGDYARGANQVSTLSALGVPCG